MSIETIVAPGVSDSHHRDSIEPLDLALMSPASSGDDLRFSEYIGIPLTEAKAQVVEALERSLITSALDRAGSNISEAARQLGMHRQSLQQKMAQLGIRAASK